MKVVSKLSAISSVIYNPMLHSQPFADAVFLSGLGNATKGLMSSRRAYHFFDALYRKQPKEAGGKWHRDYPVTEGLKSYNDQISVWLALSAVEGSFDGGGLVFAAGSHKWAKSEGCSGLDHIGGEIVNTGWEGYGECIKRLQEVSATLPKLEVGDGVAFHPSVFHRTASSHARTTPRLALSLVATSERATMHREPLRDGILGVGQSRDPFECTVKGKMDFALDESGARDGDLMVDVGLLAELEPMNAITGPARLKPLLTSRDVSRRSMHHILWDVLTVCSARKKLGLIPNSYRPCPACE